MTSAGARQASFPASTEQCQFSFMWTYNNKAPLMMLKQALGY